MMKKRELDNMFKERFGFLFTDFRFKIISSKKENWGYKLVAANLTTGVEITYEFREAYIEVNLFKLIDGKIINNMQHAMRNDDPMLGFGLGWVIMLKKPEARIKSAYEYEINFIDYSLMVADRLKEYASDILNGDFSSFDALNTMVKEYWKEYFKNQNSP